jgi:hypothetical protein
MTYCERFIMKSQNIAWWSHHVQQLSDELFESARNNATTNEILIQLRVARLRRAMAIEEKISR